VADQAAPSLPDPPHCPGARTPDENAPISLLMRNGDMHMIDIYLVIAKV
jgi:hypothetical protein